MHTNANCQERKVPVIATASQDKELDQVKAKAPGIITVNQEELLDHVKEYTRSTVEEMLNGLLDAEADELCNAHKYEHTEQRASTRAGYYNRNFLTTAGPVNLKMPRLRQLTFETAIIERYRRRESSVEEALVQMYLAGVSVRRIEDITEQLWGARVSPGTISELNQKIYGRIEEWRNRPLTEEYPYLYLDGIWLKRSWGGEVRNVAILVAIGVTASGYREIIGVTEGGREDEAGWLEFLRHLKERGLKGVRLVVSDKCLGLLEALGAALPDALWQRCVVHFYRDVRRLLPKGKIEGVMRMLSAIHAQEDRDAALAKAMEVADKLETMDLKKAAKVLREGIAETLSYYSFPPSHWRKLRTNNMLERVNREIRRRTRVVGNFPDGHSALMLVAARLRYIASSQWGTARYMSMEGTEEKA